VGTDVILQPVPIFQSTRHFEVVTWSPGHGGLLLRTRPVESLPPDEPFDRIEVWFKPADVVCLPVRLYGLTVDDAESDAKGRITRSLGRDLAAWENAYVIGSNDACRLVGRRQRERSGRQKAVRCADFLQRLVSATRRDGAVQSQRPLGERERHFGAIEVQSVERTQAAPTATLSASSSASRSSTSPRVGSDAIGWPIPTTR